MTPSGLIRKNSCSLSKNRKKERKGEKASARRARGLEKVRRAVETFAISTGSLLLHPLLHTLFLKKHPCLASQFIKSLAVLALITDLAWLAKLPI